MSTPANKSDIKVLFFPSLTIIIKNGSIGPVWIKEHNVC